MNQQFNWKTVFSFSRSEQRGILMLIFLILAVNGIRLLMPRQQQLAAEEVTLLQSEAEAFLHQLQETGKQVRTATTDTKQAIRSDPFILELNSADTFDLQRLRGIGPAFARRITQYRARLGGFLHKEQLLEVWGMDQSRYNGVKQYVTVDAEKITKINLNQATFKQMMAHPYMPFELAKEIAVLRTKRKGTLSLGEIMALAAMDTLSRVRLVPYITVE